LLEQIAKEKAKAAMKLAKVEQKKRQASEMTASEPNSDSDMKRKKKRSSRRGKSREGDHGE